MLDVSPGYWPRLVHICRRWRYIVFASQKALHVQLSCTHGTPILKTLDCWPTLPIIVQYGGFSNLDPPAPEDEENIVAALKQSDRVSSLSLVVTSSLLEKISTIERPFWQLEDLILLSPQDSVPLTLPSAFRWGSHLRCLHLTRITFPLLLQLLYSSRNLEDLRLHEVLDPRHFLPETLANALSWMTQLRSLSLHFPSTIDDTGVSTPSWTRAVLPALTSFNFRGITKYLEDLVARIDTPRLRSIEVTLLNESIFYLPKLSEFIYRIELHKSYRRADILLSERDMSISLTQTGTPTCIKLQVFNGLSEQLFSMARICNDFSSVLLNVEDLRISATRRSSWGDVMGFLALMNSFTGVKWFQVPENLSKDVMTALQLPDRRKNMLPALQTLFISKSESQTGPRPARLSEVVASFMTSRSLSGHPIRVEYDRLCHISDLRGTGTFHAEPGATATNL